MDGNSCKRHIHNLPDELLIEIFYLHVFLNRQSRWSLLTTCRRWYNVATRYTTLWRTISWCDRDKLHPTNVKCTSLRGLAQVVNRTGSSTFELRVGCPYEDPFLEDCLYFFSSVDKRWLSKCRTLSLFAPKAEEKSCSSDMLWELIRSSSFESLECLELLHSEKEIWESMLETLVSRVESTSPKLKTFKMECANVSSAITNSVFQRPILLGRIRTLQLGGIQQPVPWEDFPRLETLEFRNPSRSNLSDLTAPKLTNLTLVGCFQMNELPRKVFHQLAHLTLVEFRPPYLGYQWPLSLPSLGSLTLVWTNHNLGRDYIDAPKLHELNFKIDPHDENPYIYPELTDATICPRVLRLDMLTEEDGYESQIFSQPLAIWKHVEELHLTTFRSSKVVLTLFDTISGTNGEQCFPVLRCLTVLCPSPDDASQASDDSSQAPDDASQAPEWEIINEARKIIIARAAAGLKPLERLQLGWYWTNDNNYVLEDPSREWWVTTWDDPLK